MQKKPPSKSAKPFSSISSPKPQRDNSQFERISEKTEIELLAQGMDGL
jgi:hypothetical protein